MADDFVIMAVVTLVGFAAGGIAGWKIGYAYGVRVEQGFSLTEWLKSLLPFGGMP